MGTLLHNFRTLYSNKISSWWIILVVIWYLVDLESRTHFGCITTAWFCCVWAYSWVRGASAAHVTACPWLTGGDGTPPAPPGSAGWMLPPLLKGTLLQRAQKNYTWNAKSDQNLIIILHLHILYIRRHSHININKACIMPTVIEYFTPVAPREGKTGIFSFLLNLLICQFPPNSQLSHHVTSSNQWKEKVIPRLLQDVKSAIQTFSNCCITGQHNAHRGKH